MTAPLETFRFLMGAAYPGVLAPEHRDDLEKSGLVKETITAHGFRSVPPNMIGPLIGWDTPHIRSAYLLPYPDPVSALSGRGPAWLDHVVIRLFPPFKPLDKDGKETRGTIKYAQPRSTPPRLYFPRLGLAEVLSGTAEPLWIVEGQKKALAVAETGRAAVGFSGVQAWHVKGSRELLADFDLIPLEGRVVELVPDGDVQSNPDVARGATRLAGALQAHGAAVRIVLLPHVFEEVAPS
jgi:hypothetical protein